MKRKTTKIEVLKYEVDVTQQHIDDGECGKAHLCMHKVANAEALMMLGAGESDADLRVRVDAGHINFNAYGYRWIADAPRIVNNTLIKYDLYGKNAVRPHSYTVTARRRNKIVKATRARQEQINEARRKRIQHGAEPVRYRSIHDRVVGYSSRSKTDG